MKFPCLAAHLTVDEQFRVGDAMLSPGHFRGLFQYGEHTLKVGIYFDETGEVIRMTVSILDHAHKAPILEGDPLFSQIKQAITAHYLPFQALFTHLMQLKTKEIERLTTDLTLQDMELSQQIEGGHYDQASRLKLLDEIQSFIDQVTLVNRYHDNIQDVRHIQYEKLHQIISDTPIREATPPNTIADSQIIVSPSSAEPTSAVSEPPKLSKWAQTQNTIRTIVDGILEQLVTANLLDAPKAVQFIAVQTHLEQLELACWSVLFYANEHKQRFIAEQKARLGFVALYIGVYFNTALEANDQATVKTLLPQLNLFSKYGHFYHFLQSLKENRPNIAELCAMARFLHTEDQKFRDVFYIQQSLLVGYKIKGTPVYQRFVMTLFLNNNIESFRLFLKNYDALQEPHLIVNDQQYSIMEACIYFDMPHSAQFVQALLDHGMQITHTLNLMSAASLQNMAIQAQKKHKSSKKLKHCTAYCHGTERDGLALAIGTQSNLNLIQTLANQSSPEVLITNLSKCLLGPDYALHLNNTSRPIVGLVDSSQYRHTVLQQYPFAKEAVSIACIFYPVDNTTEWADDNFEIIQALMARFQHISNEKSDLEKRDVIKTFIHKMRQEQKKEETLVVAMIFILAGLFAWTQIADPNVDDYTDVLQLLFYRGAIGRKLYRNTSEEITLGTFRVGINLIMNLSDELSQILQQTQLFKIMNQSVAVSTDRLIQRHNAGQFKPAGIMTATSELKMSFNGANPN